MMSNTIQTGPHPMSNPHFDPDETGDPTPRRTSSWHASTAVQLGRLLNEMDALMDERDDPRNLCRYDELTRQIRANGALRSGLIRALKAATR